MLDEILSKYPRMLQDAVARRDEDWFRYSTLPANVQSHERTKFPETLDLGFLEKFRNHVVGGIGVELLDYGVDRATALNLREFQKLDYEPLYVGMPVAGILETGLTKALGTIAPENRELFLSFADDAVDCGGLKGLGVVDGRMRICSAFSIRLALRAERTIRRLAEAGCRPNCVLELGGGFGKTFADILSWARPDTAILIDLPLNMALSARYLSAVFPGRVNLVWFPEDHVSEGRINIVAPWLVPEKVTIDIDLMINYLSLHHMQTETQEYYFDAVVGNRTKWLFHENRLRPRDRIEGALLESRFRSAGEIVSGVSLGSPDFHNEAGEVVANARLEIRSELIRY